jgi:anhydro-N-acetylmuramic acid kinase
MSGTSLDGIDLAACQFFTDEAGRWSYKVLAADTYKYPTEWEQRLRNAMSLSGLELSLLDRGLGKFLGEQVRGFVTKHSINADWVASHGHTVFHQPEKGLSLQIGHGYSLMAAAGLPVISDFRSLDVALGGQGAPLVPIGDALLYSQYKYCLNLGGIANISFENGGKRIAYDICPANGVLNWLAQKEGKAYDADGAMAASGKVIPELLQELNSLPFYALPAPKSLGFEWVEANILPLLNRFQRYSTADLSQTFCQHMAVQIRQAIDKNMVTTAGKILVTGGGAHHIEFINILRKELDKLSVEVVIPDRQTIEFKEAIVFAFLGHLRLTRQTNSLKTVTGASRNSIGGAIYSERVY